MHESLARKQRSHAILQREGVPIHEHLPLLETEAQTKRRTTEEVCQRAMALFVVSRRAEGLAAGEAARLAADYRVEGALSPKEMAFLAAPRVEELENIQFLRRFESYWVMLWALSFVDRLERPDRSCDPALAVGIPTEFGRDGFLRRAALRPQAELLDEDDLIYRYHWAVEEARLRKLRPPGGLLADVVRERHHALNWLVGYQERDWDEVSTET